MTTQADKTPPKFVTVSSQRFDGFFQYVEGNQITGKIIEEKIKPKQNAEGKTVDKGFFSVECILAGTCQANLDKADDKGFTAEIGQLIGVPFTEATKVLRGHVGEICRVTYKGMKKNGERKFHEFVVELAKT